MLHMNAGLALAYFDLWLLESKDRTWNPQTGWGSEYQSWAGHGGHLGHEDHRRHRVKEIQSTGGGWSA